MCEHTLSLKHVFVSVLVSDLKFFPLPLVLGPVRATSNYEGTNLRLARII